MERRKKRWRPVPIVIGVIVLGGIPRGFVSAREVPIPAEWRACAASADCVDVETLCSACCGMDAVAHRYAKAYRERYQQGCTGVNSSVCDCIPAPGRIDCLRGRCERVATVPHR